MLIAACGSSSPSASSAAGTPSPPVSRVPATTAGPASSTPAPAAPATPGVAGTWIGYGPCPDLEVKLGLVEHDTAVTYQVIDFTNRGSVTCALAGYPGVSLASGRPAVPIGLPAGHTELTVPAKVLTLQPGGVANATLEIPDARRYAQGKCGPVRAQYLIIYRPNQASPVTLSFTATACSKPVQLLQVSAVSIGTGG
jgi:hypothetical protein